MSITPISTSQSSKELLDIIANLTEADPEVFRREPRTMETGPMAQMLPLDYATAGTLIDRAISHLDESLVLGQKRRTETSLNMLRKGVDELFVWCRARGYNV